MAVFAADAIGSASPAPFFGTRDEDQPEEMKQNTTTQAMGLPQLKKKRNLPGNPNPDSEVIALSPKTLMATNRFICEVCNKGFQREQNLQLHRRGHNLPWKLKLKSGNNKDAKRKVYLCPEPTCVHHEPARALGDLTGIKKHYFRKHGEKNYKCEKCQKRYAVQSDWKAHSKTCGTREYRCDCGTLFSRRDSFVTHRAFCEVLAVESARNPIGLGTMSRNIYRTASMGLGQPSSQVNLISGPLLQEQNQAGRNMLRPDNSNGGQAKYERHYMASSNSPRFAQSPLSSLPQPNLVFVGESNPGPYPSQQHRQGLSQPINCSRRSPNLQDLMHLPAQIETSNTSLSGGSPAPSSLMPNSFFNLGFTNNDPNANMSASVDFVIPQPDQYGSETVGAQGCGNSGGGDSNIFSSLYATNHISQQNNYTLLSAPMPSTTLLHKASDLEPSASDSSMVPESMGSSSSSCPNPVPAAPQMMMSALGSENHLDGLMDSLMNGSPSVFATPRPHNGGDNNFTTLFNANGSVRMGPMSDRPTLDFLGVGGTSGMDVGSMGMVSINVGDDDFGSIVGMGMAMTMNSLVQK